MKFIALYDKCILFEWVRVVKLYVAWILSQQPGIGSHLGKTIKKYQKPPSVPLMTASRMVYLKNDLNFFAMLMKKFFPICQADLRKTTKWYRKK